MFTPRGLSLPQCKSRLRGLVLVNPATSFNGSAIHRVGSFVAHAPSPEMFGATAVLALAASIPDTAMVRVIEYFVDHDGESDIYR